MSYEFSATEEIIIFIIGILIVIKLLKDGHLDPPNE